jgi:hypothetical protein
MTRERQRGIEASWILRLKALRSLTTALTASTLGVLIGHDSLAVVLLVMLIAGMAVSAWSLVNEESRLDLLTSKSKACKGAKPISTRSGTEVVKVLIPLPLGIATVYGISRVGQVTGIQSSILLGSLSGLLLGLALSRTRLATKLALWEKQRGVCALYRCSGLSDAEGPLYIYRVDASRADSVTDPEMK